MVFLIVIIVVLVVGGIVSATMRHPMYEQGCELRDAFLRLGNMRGKAASEIISAVGAPSSISNLANGKRLRQWSAVGYRMAILFDVQDQVERITHQYAKLPK